MPNGCGDKLTCRTAALAAVLCWVASAQASSISLWREAVVTGDEVRLSDICQLRGIESDEAEDYADIVVTAAPVVGGSVIVCIADVRRALQAGGVNLANVVLKGAASCDVTRPRELVHQRAAESSSPSATEVEASPPAARTLRDALEEFLNAQLAVPGGQAHVQYGHVSAAALELRQPEFQFRIRCTSGRRLGLVGLEVTVLADGEQEQLLPLMVNVSLVKPVVVAARSINLGATVSAGDVRTVKMTFTRFDQVGESNPAAVIGQRAKRFIGAGQVVTQRHLEPVPLVRRGQIVDVNSRVGGVAIVTAAKALTCGAYGDVVELRASERGKKKLSATVTGPGRVSVRPEGWALARGGGR